jgi:hypothetical protein
MPNTRDRKKTQRATPATTWERVKQLNGGGAQTTAGRAEPDAPLSVAISSIESATGGIHELLGRLRRVGDSLFGGALIGKVTETPAAPEPAGQLHAALGALQEEVARLETL